jgi:hypothetical protein
MTKSIFRISWDDSEKLRPIFETFGKKPFTITTAQTECLPELTSGDIKRWNSSLYIVRTGTTLSEKKYHHPINEWKLTDRVINRLTQTPRRR